MIIHKIARASAILGISVLVGLTIIMTLSIIGGGIAKLAYSEWMNIQFPAIAEWLKNTNIRTISGMYEIMKIGIAFTIFACLPYASITQNHAVVDVFAKLLGNKINKIIIKFWEIILFGVFVIITWRLFHGMERVMNANIILQDLNIPEWYGYAIAVVQMGVVSIVQGYVTFFPTKIPKKIPIKIPIKIPKKIIGRK